MTKYTVSESGESSVENKTRLRMDTVREEERKKKEREAKEKEKQEKEREARAQAGGRR